MSKAEPAAFSRPARNGAVSAAGPTTPSLMPLGCGLWYVPMMQTANPITKKTGISVAPSASFICTRCFSCTGVSAYVSFVIARSSFRVVIGLLHADLDVAVDLPHLVGAERLGGGTAEYGTGGDVKPGAVALAHQGCPGEQASGER